MTSRSDEEIEHLRGLEADPRFLRGMGTRKVPHDFKHNTQARDRRNRCYAMCILVGMFLAAAALIGGGLYNIYWR